jgi:hypothetical protein
LCKMLPDPRFIRYSGGTEMREGRTPETRRSSGEKLLRPVSSRSLFHGSVYPAIPTRRLEQNDAYQAKLSPSHFCGSFGPSIHVRLFRRLEAAARSPLPKV